VKHLDDEQLIAVLEGTADERAASHLRSCAACTAQMADLRATLDAVQRLEVPEPSPLFWDQLSDRVHEAVAAEERRRPGSGLWTWWTLAPFAAAAAAVIVAALHVGAPKAGPSPVPAAAVATAAADVAPLPPLGDQDDPSLALVASMASQVDEAAAIDSGLVTHADGLDDAVNTLTDAERAELGRILKDEIAKS